MTRGVASAGVAMLLLLVGTMGAMGSPSTNAVSVMLEDGGAWTDGAIRLDGVECVRIVSEGTVTSVDRGQAALVDVDGIGRIAVFFAQNAPMSVRAAVTAPGVSFDTRVGYAEDARENTYSRTVEACRPAGKTFDGVFAVRAYHTDGIVADATRIEATTGAIAWDHASRGTEVRLWNTRDFTRGVAVEVVGPTVANSATGQSVLVGTQLDVDVDAPVFGTFVLFEAAAAWQLVGPGNVLAYQSPFASGGNVEASSFHGPAGHWQARVDRSVSMGTPGQAFFVLAGMDRET